MRKNKPHFKQLKTLEGRTRWLAWHNKVASKYFLPAASGSTFYECLANLVDVSPILANTKCRVVLRGSQTLYWVDSPNPTDFAGWTRKVENAQVLTLKEILDGIYCCTREQRITSLVQGYITIEYV